MGYCKIDISEVDVVCWYEEPDLKYDRVKHSLGKHWFRSFGKKWRHFKKEFSKTEGDLQSYLIKTIGYVGEIQYVPHHLSHIAFSHYTSPYKNSVALAIDGVGEWETVLGIRCVDNHFSYIDSIEFPNSLGLVYSTITAYLGFKPNSGEYKVMGLAPYGDPSQYEYVFNTITTSDKNSLLKINQKYFTWEYSNTDMFTYNLVNLIGFTPREPESNIEQYHKDLAAALQRWYETQFYYLVNKFMDDQHTGNLVLGGGSAYNGTANGRVLEKTIANNVWIPYAPSDAGSAIGACLYYWHNLLGNKKVKGGDNKSPFLGPEYNNMHIEFKLWSHSGADVLFKSEKLPTKELLKKTAKLINDGAIVGWFQGRTEFGARALGNRSILANPHISDVKDRINRVVKKREMFRPFAPSVTFEDYGKYFESEGEVPYMNQVVKVKPNVYIPSVTHVDNSARIHTVRRKQNPLYYDLLKEFEKISGTPILLNTSFNLRGHTISNTPNTAIWTFLNSDMDYLVIGNYLVYKL